MDEYGFELFEHTADIGIRIRARSPEELLNLAAAGLYECIGEIVATDPAGELQLELNGSSKELLLRDYLAELLFHFESRHVVIRDLHLRELSSSRLSFEGRLFAVDDEQSVYYREVKAVTYHQLSLTETQTGRGACYEANVIVDI